jgi:hypothetical protein
VKRYRFGTFCNFGPDLRVKRLCLSAISAYTTWFSPQWPGCVVYSVEAASGQEAKNKARVMRLKDEQTGKTIVRLMNERARRG